MNATLWPMVVAIALRVFLGIDVACIPLTGGDPMPDASGPAFNRTEKEGYRLNEDVWPTHYDIEITPHFVDERNESAFTFDGATTITIAARNEGVTQIKLHQANLSILSWDVLRQSNSKAVRRGNETYDALAEVLTLELGEPLLPNVTYLLTFNYVGVIGDEFRGFYRSYFNRSGEVVWLGTTQFEQCDARRAFPCFDEPKFKATFQLKIIHNPFEYSVYSNTPSIGTVDLGYNRTLTTFGVTPKMSTYLLAFVVAPFESYGQDEVRVLARPEFSNQTGYSIDVGRRLLRHLGDWIDYPFDAVPEITRMYLVAVPHLLSGAMENWGLTTYREFNLLCAPEDATSLEQQKTATILAHELAHQWFGNLVTCEWWDVLWLNEGLATYMEYFAMASVEPGWELEQQFVVDKLQEAMQLDKADAAHPLTHPVYTQDEAYGMFNVISYHKGAAVLRMMEHFLTADVFKSILREYVKENAFNTVRPEDLFAVLDRHNAHARAYMEPWTTQPGFPLVTVAATEEGFTLTQKRFLANGTAHNESWLWPVPITYATKAEDFANTVPTFVATESHNVSVTRAASVEYFILNNQQLGYYRVNYEASLWDRISQALRSKHFGGIHLLNRAQIVDDLFNLAEASVLSYGVVLGILEYLKDETEYLPWRAAERGFLTLSHRIHPDDETLFSQHVLEIFGPAYERVKFQAPSSSERRVHTYLRRMVLEWTCRYGHEDCRKSAMKEFERVRTNPSVKVHPDLRPIVYCEGARQGSNEQFEFLLHLYHSTHVVKEKQLVLEGLSCVAEDALIHKYLNFIHSSSIGKQNARSALDLLLSHPYTISSATAYFIQNEDTVDEFFGQPMSVMYPMYDILTYSKDVRVREVLREYTDSHREEWGTLRYDYFAGAFVDFESNQQLMLARRGEIREYLSKIDGRGAGPATVASSVTWALSVALVAFNGW